jgi:magnesium transporter
VRPYFQDVDDHLIQVSERVAGFDEVLTSLVDAALAKITLQQSTDMRRISSWVAIMAVPTMVFGLYGMNFDFMPELHWTLGYPAVILVVLVVCMILFRVFRRNDWL